MSETEDNERAKRRGTQGKNIRAVVQNTDFDSIIEGESGRSSSVDYLDTCEDILKEPARVTPVNYKEEEIQDGGRIDEDKKVIEPEKTETTKPAVPTPETSDSVDGGARREEAVSTRVGAAGTTDGRNESAPVGEWNSLPVLVERLREALELSLATGSRRDDEPPTTVPEDSGVDSEEDFRIRSSMEQALGDCKEPEIKRDLKFLEDLLLSDIQTALSRLRETLERTDVAALAKHGAASDPTSKLHLLRLVSSLLSRLQVPEETLVEKTPILTASTSSKRRRGTRHTIGVSTEELARARKWLEEDRNCLPLDDVVSVIKEQKDQIVNVQVDRKPEEVRDKCTKDAINQRQLLEDKNKEIRENGVYRGIQQVDTDVNGETNMYPAPCRVNVGYQGKENTENDVEGNEEKSRVSKLAAALRQRAELASAGKYGGSNKFSVKKSKIKRANTIDIPSYLKLQAESLGHETTGCISLRRPINVGDKTAFNSVNVTVPTLQPKTENDRKFLALINKNNEPPITPPVVPFKTFGFAKNMDMQSLTDKNWNNRFSNIKTTFDKPSGNEGRENRPSLKARANKWFPGVPQQAYGPQNERTPGSSSNFTAPAMRMDSGSGFRHAPSSPFRKIEKSSATSPSKVPPSYHWPKHAPAPTNTLKEKARMMFDRETVQPPSKPRPDAEVHEKQGFPRPPWIDQDRHEGKQNGTVTENGRLDYRSFCKQFAPFVGKGSVESKKYEDQRRGSLQRDRIPGVVDGKFSFKMVPDKRAHQFPPVERVKEKFGAETKNAFEVIKSGYERGYGETDSKTNQFADATLRGSSSVAVQTGVDDDHQDEGRSFRVAPRILKGSTLVCSNASVQTTSDLERPTISVSDVESGKQWKPLSYEQTDTDLAPDQVPHPDQRIVYDHNQNYRPVSSDSEINDPTILQSPRQVSSEQDFRESAPFQATKSYQTQDEEPQDYSSSIPLDYKKLNETSETSEKVADWSVESPNFPDDQNIQNQDISPEVGVVTRYTCAIATVSSSVDSPEPHSEEVVIDSRASSSPSPSQWSSSKSRPPTNETSTPEDEIRRHNLLQQSIVRRLQNEITTLNEQPQQLQSSYGQHLTVSQSRSISQPTNPVQPSHLPQSHQSYSQPANFDQPSGSRDRSPGRVAKFLAPVPQKKPEPPTTHSPVPVGATRVGALRDAYEQPPSTQTKPISKERSPIPNGATPNDSSDEYLVSCATKPSRSIVLSKSESWHQLALSTRAPRVNAPASAPKSHASSHPKPPKPRSPSSQKLRSKQFEASSMADSVKKMEDKIRQYFDHPADAVESRESSRHRRSPRAAAKGMVGLSRSRTMPGLSDERLRLLIPAPQQVPLLNVNTADVDKVFDDLFEETTRTDSQQC